MNSPALVRVLRFIVCSLAAFGALARAAEITPELICDLKIAEDAQLSPDGKWVTYLVSDETARDGKKSVELWMASAAGELSERRLLPAHLRVSIARWSPRENQLAAVISDESSSSRQRQLVLIAPDGSVTRTLADNFSGSISCGRRTEKASATSSGNRASPR
jgi:dipeptidyl aminopeptidase/acylaminoacyl peptidase